MSISLSTSTHVDSGSRIAVRSIGGNPSIQFGDSGYPQSNVFFKDKQEAWRFAHLLFEYLANEEDQVSEGVKKDD